MSNVPTITPGPTIPRARRKVLPKPYRSSRAFTPHRKTIMSKPTPGFPTMRHTPNSRLSVPSDGIKSSFAAVSQPASWVALS